MKYILHIITIWFYTTSFGQLYTGIDTLILNTRDTIIHNSPCGAYQAVPPNGNIFTFFDDYILPNINYDSVQNDLKLKKVGFFEIQFVIETDGSISSIEILKSFSPQIDKEIKRIISESKWTPQIVQLGIKRQRKVLKTYFEY